MKTSFYILGLFQTITPNVAIEKRKIFNNDALFEGAICKDWKLIFCAVGGHLDRGHLIGRGG